MKLADNELNRGDLQRPLSRQIAAILRVSIEGQTTQNVRLPTERELAQIFAVSRVTVRRALEHLHRAGLIHSQVGRGTFVNPVPVGQRLPDEA